MTTIAVMAHAGAESIFHRNLPLWEGLADRYILLCPCDATLQHEPTGWEVVVTGYQGLYTEHACSRVVSYLHALVAAVDGPVFLTEYDAGPVSDIPWHFVDMGNILFCNGWEDNGQYLAHPPFLANRETLANLYTNLFEAISAGMPGKSISERVFPDRFIGTAVIAKAIESCGWERSLKRGFTRNTIEPHDLSALDTYLEKHPGTMVHGIKSPESLGIVMKWRNQEQKRKELL